MGGLVASFGALLVAAFFATLAFAPRLPAVSLKDPRVAARRCTSETAHKLKGRGQWNRIPHPRAARRPAARRGRWRSASTCPGTRARGESLADHVDQLDVVSPQWIALDGADGERRDHLRPAGPRDHRRGQASAVDPAGGLNNAARRRLGRAAWPTPCCSTPPARDRADRQPGRPGPEARLRRLCLRLRGPVAGRRQAYPGFIAQARAALKPHRPRGLGHHALRRRRLARSRPCRTPPTPWC